jgi:hypothetical protein
MLKDIIRTKISSSKLKENLSKHFDMNVNLENYNRAQLEDMRNKIRTRIFQYEGSSKFNDLLQNESYQKDKAMLELLNTRIKEMLGEDIAKLRDRMVELNEGKKDVKIAKHPRGTKGSKPDFLDLDKDGNKTEPMRQAAQQAKKPVSKKSPTKGMSAKQAKYFGETAKGKCCCASKGEDKCPVHGKVEEAWPGTPGGYQSKVGKPQPSGGSGIKKGSRYGGSAQKDDDAETPAKPKTKDAKHKDWEARLAALGTRESKEPSCGHTKKVKGCKECMGMWESKVTEKWAGDTKLNPAKKDMFKGKNKAELEKQLARLKKSGPHKKGSAEYTKMKELNFAIRAKSGWPKGKSKAEEGQSIFRYNVRIVNESLKHLLNEDEESKAKLITAAGDMVNDFTSWMQRVGQYQTKTMIELADSIKHEFGAQESEAFKQSVGPALATTLENLTAQREAISQAVAVLAGEATPASPMGAEPMPGGEVGAGTPDALNPEPLAGGDEFSAADAAAGGPEAAGRAMRENKQQHRARKLAESHSIISKLAK